MHNEDYEDHAIARCAECKTLIYEDDRNTYLDNDGNYFCCYKCALDYYYIHKLED
jgi:hypothetical protein